MNSIATTFSGTAAFIWSVADLLRGDFKQSQYGRIILPFTLLRRLECVLEPTKAAVLKQSKAVEDMPEEAARKLLLHSLILHVCVCVATRYHHAGHGRHGHRDHLHVCSH